MLLLIVACLAGVHSSAAQGPTKRVILITIDGMSATMVDDADMPAPTLKMMKREGMYVPRVVGVPPTATYPSHTTIVTGALPSRHHIYYNSPFVANKDSVVSYWFADSIGVPTIWQVAKAAGLKTASLFWPTTTGARHIDYNVPEYWSVKPVANQLDFIKPFCTPTGLLDELETNAVGRLDHTTFWAGSINRDARTAYMANYILNRYHPDLMTIHLITTDYAQHATGKHSEETRRAVASVDNAVALILENLKITGQQDSTTVIVCGDHGFCDVTQAIAPNVWLVKAGLLSKEPGGKWKACFHRSGASMFLYLKDSTDTKTLRRVVRLIDALPDSTRALFEVVSRERITAMGGDPKVALALSPVAGVMTVANRVGADVKPMAGGSHGYLSGIDPTCLLVYSSAATRKGQVADSVRQVDLAPYVAHLLGLTHRFPDGSLPTALAR